MSDLDPEFLELEDVFELHADSIARYGGDLGVRDRALIECAVAVPRQSFEMAAAYAFHIAESQGFVDGNKRAGRACEPRVRRRLRESQCVGYRSHVTFPAPFVEWLGPSRDPALIRMEGGARFCPIR